MYCTIVDLPEILNQHHFKTKSTEKYDAKYTRTGYPFPSHERLEELLRPVIGESGYQWLKLMAEKKDGWVGELQERIWCS